MWSFQLEKNDKQLTKQVILCLIGAALMVIPFFIWLYLIISGVVPQVSENVTLLEVISKPQVILILLVIFAGWLIMGKALISNWQTEKA